MTDISCGVVYEATLAFLVLFRSYCYVSAVSRLVAVVPVVWTVDSLPLASREVCLAVLVQLVPPAGGLSAKKVGRTSSKFEKDDRLTTLPLLPDVLEVLRTTHMSISVSDIPANVLHPSDPHKVS